MDIETLQRQEYQYLKERQQAEVELKSVVAREGYLRKYLAQVDGAIEDCQLWLGKANEETPEGDSPIHLTE